MGAYSLFSSPEYVIPIALLVGTLYWIFSSGDLVYRRFKRADTFRLTFTPIHEIVQTGFDQVCE